VAGAVYGREIEMIDRKMAKYDQESVEYKKLARQKAELEYKQAIMNKAFALTQSIVNTALGVTAALAIQNYIGAALIGIAGAAESAKIALEPLPEIPSFAKGTSDFQGGLARFGEAGRELAITPNNDLIWQIRKLLRNFHDITKILNNARTEHILSDLNYTNSVNNKPITDLLEENNYLTKKLLTKGTKNIIFVNVKNDYRNKLKYN
jgi:hypothetical protein